MAHSNSTQYYNLPQFDSTDKPAWLVDVNPAYSAIDAGIHAAKASADSAQSDATQALSDASSAGTTASGADAKAAGSIASLADTFDTTATYNVGDLVIYNNLLYICSVDVIVPGAWTGSTNWNRTTLETEINKKQDTIDRLTSVSSLTATDEVAIYDGTDTKKATVENVIKLVSDSFYGDEISIPISLNTVGDYSIGFTVPTPPTGYTLCGYLMRTNTYRAYIKGIAGSDIYYTVTSAHTITGNLLLTPVYKKN